MKKKLICITGGIGSGKSAVLKIVAKSGYPVISADDVNRELLADAGYLELLKSHFPESFVGGVFSKKALTDIVFGDDAKRLELNAIAHSRIQSIIENRLERIMSNYVFVEVPLLVESGMKDIFDEIIVVTADRKTKIARVMHRDNATRDEVIARMNAQLDDSELIALATHVIDNNSTFSDLADKVNDVFKLL